jgi:3-oxoacyl-[acyl-carrier protein] reductase
MDLNLTGKHALVCGGSQGIGRAAAIALAELGADVTVMARTEAGLLAAVAALPRPHPAQRHTHLVADVADSADLGRKVAAIVGAHPVQILVNNTGGPAPGAAKDAAPADYLDTFQRHLIANQVLVQAVLAGMQAAGYGRIVNVISTSVKEPIRNLGVSNTIRGAVASWAKTLATELGGYGITVNNVLPGYTRTQRLDQILADRSRATGKSEDEVAKAMLATVPAGRFAEAGEVANAIAFLASPAAGYINGINVPVDGGRTHSL